MFNKRFALAASVATLALAGCGAATLTTASVNAGSAASGAQPTTPTATTASGAPSGAPSGGTRPQMQTVTGTAATKASAAATAKYPGTVQRVVKIGTGYVVDITTTSGTTKHVQVSTDFTVTGLMTAPSGGPGGGTPPNGVQPKGGGASATTPTAVASS